MWSRKEGGDERKLPWGVQEMRENVCQEVEKPADRDHVEGTDSGGLGSACEKSREGGEEMENICSVYLLRSRMHDHNPFTIPQAFLYAAPIFTSPFLCLLPHLSPLCLFIPLSLCSSFSSSLPLSCYSTARKARSQILKSFKIGLVRINIRYGYVTVACDSQ